MKQGRKEDARLVQGLVYAVSGALFAFLGGPNYFGYLDQYYLIVLPVSFVVILAGFAKWTRYLSDLVRKNNGEIGE